MYYFILSGGDNQKRDAPGQQPGVVASLGPDGKFTFNEETLPDIFPGLHAPPSCPPGHALCHGLIDRREPEPINPIAGLVLGQGASFGASQLVQEGIKKIEDLFHKREPEPINPIAGLVLGQGASFGASQLVQEGIKKIEDLFHKRGLSLEDLE